MKISELTARLQDCADTHGDIEVELYNNEFNSSDPCAATEIVRTVTGHTIILLGSR